MSAVDGPAFDVYQGAAVRRASASAGRCPAVAYQDWTGCSVAPRTRTRRLPCSITVRTYTFVPLSRSAVKKSSARIPGAWDRRNFRPARAVPAGRRVDPGVLEDLPHR